MLLTNTLVMKEVTNLPVFVCPGKIFKLHAEGLKYTTSAKASTLF